uniref:Odorant receptor n=1 Tax=Meteorus pulchricornis TaxID=51522 RepID=A0A1S5VFM3_9HYME|nr:olfactory receptor 37 [Meteorus pulchricornis]
MPELTPETIFTFTKFSVYLIMSWPSENETTKNGNIIFNIKWWILWMNSILFIAFCVYGAYGDRQDVLSCTEILFIITAVIQYPIKMLICRIIREQMQFVVNEMECHIHSAEPSKRIILSNYLKKPGVVYVLYHFVACLGFLGMVLAAFILQEPLPVKIRYPFSIDTRLVFIFVYFQQFIFGIQAITTTSIDSQIALMLWYVVARLRILQEQMRKISNMYEFRKCIQQHQYILRLADEVISVGKYILATTVVMSTLSLILGAILIVKAHQMTVRLKFSINVVTVSATLFMSAWPSEMLISSVSSATNYYIRKILWNITRQIIFSNIFSQESNKLALCLHQILIIVVLQINIYLLDE